MVANIATNQTASELTYLGVQDVTAFQYNPRQVRNPEYDRLVASIKQNGLEQPLLVSRLPEEQIYTLQNGGNTRLDICKRLYKDGDKRFAKLPCVIQPWVSHVHALIAHLRETEMHGSLAFIDRAKAVLQIGELAKKKGQEKRLSQRALTKVLQQYGYPLSQGMISYMEYAVESLYPHMPLAFDSGLGKNRVVRIRNLQNAAGQIWTREVDEEEDSFEEVFNSLCERHDSADWDFETFETAVNYELSMATDMDQSVASIMCSEEQLGRSINLPPPLILNQTDQPNASIAVSLDQKTKDRFELKRLRKKLCKHTKLLAAIEDMDDLVAGTGDSLFGYLVTDLPPENASVVSLAIWSFLIACCEQTKATKAVLLRFLPPASRLTLALTSDRIDCVVQVASPMRLSDCGEHLISQLDERSWHTFMTAISTYRAVKKLAGKLQIDLWKDF